MDTNISPPGVIGEDTACVTILDNDRKLWCDNVLNTHTVMVHRRRNPWGFGAEAPPPQYL